MKKTAFTLLLLLFYITLSHSQNLEIKGTIINNNLDGVEAASVALYDKKGNLLSSTISNKQGKFTIKQNTDNKNTILNITHLSYINQSIKLNNDTTLVICLQENVIEADEIVVIGKKKAIEFKEGNLVANVSQIPNSESSTVANILKKLPGVTASDRSGLTLNGMSATLYIDGRKQNLQSTDIITVLESLPAASVDQVELISESNGMYDAEGTGAIINIKSKKQKLDGFYLTIGNENNLYADYSLDAGVNVFYMLKKNNLLINTTLSYKNDYSYKLVYDSTQFRTGTDVIIDMDKKNRMNQYIGSANLTYFMKKGHTLNFNVFGYDDFSNITTKMPTIVRDTETEQNFTTLEKSKGNDDLWSGNIEYASPDSLSGKLKVSYGFVYGGVRSKTDYFNLNNEQEEWYMYSNPRMIGHRHTFKADYKQFIGKKLSIYSGLKTDLGELKDDVIYNTESTNDNLNESHFIANENLYAAYLALVYNFTENFGIYGSLRTEYTDYDVNLKSSDSQSNDTYYNLFPYFHVYLSVSRIYQTKLSFSSNISRPNYLYLLPGKRYNNEFSYSVGNPDLKPTMKRGIVWSNYLYTYGYISLRYVQAKDIIGQVLTSKTGNITEYTYQNYADNDQFYASIFLPYEFLNKKISGKVSSTIEYSTLKNAKNGYVIDDNNKSYWKTFYEILFNYNITDKLSVFAWYGHHPDYSTPLYDYKSRYSVDFGITYSMLKNNKLTFSLEAQNIFDTYDYSYTYYYDGNIKNSYRQTSNRLIRFSIRYKINGGEKIIDKKRDNPNDINRFMKD